VLPAVDVQVLRRGLHEAPGATMTVDLDAQSVFGTDGREYRFEIDPARKLRLAKGLDDTALALEYLADIEEFEKQHVAEWPWAAPR